MADGNKLNGSVDLLARAMTKVFEECMDSTREAVQSEVRDEIRGAETRIREHVDRRIDTTDENMQAQFSEQEKKIGKLLAKR